MVPILRSGLSAVAHSGPFHAFVRLMEMFGDRRGNLLRVLTYHRVDDRHARPDLNPRLISASVAGFARQMEYLAAEYRTVSIAEVLDALRGKMPLPPKAVLITFDDAYRDFAVGAWPVMRRLGLPAVLFVPTAFPDRPWRAFWWDRLYQTIAHAAGCGVIQTPIGRFPVTSRKERAVALDRLGCHLKTLPHDRLQPTLASPRPPPADVGSSMRFAGHSAVGWARSRLGRPATTCRRRCHHGAAHENSSLDEPNFGRASAGRSVGFAGRSTA